MCRRTGPLTPTHRQLLRGRVHLCQCQSRCQTSQCLQATVSEVGPDGNETVRSRTAGSGRVKRSRHTTTRAKSSKQRRHAPPIPTIDARIDGGTDAGGSRTDLSRVRDRLLQGPRTLYRAGSRSGLGIKRSTHHQVTIGKHPRDKDDRSFSETQAEPDNCDGAIAFSPSMRRDSMPIVPGSLARVTIHIPRGLPELPEPCATSPPSCRTYQAYVKNGR